MYTIYIKYYIYHLLNESTMSIFSYNSDQSVYLKLSKSAITLLKLYVSSITPLKLTKLQLPPEIAQC